MGRNSIPVAWRLAVRDSELDTTAKAIAFTLSTYLNGQGEAFPGRKALAEGASVDTRTVDRAIARIETAGFLSVTRSKGGRAARGVGATNRYLATLPNSDVSASLNSDTSAALNGDSENSQGRLSRHSNGGTVPPEVVSLEIEREVGDRKCFVCNTNTVMLVNHSGQWWCPVHFEQETGARI